MHDRMGQREQERQGPSAAEPPVAAPAAPVLALQRAAGNRAVGALLARQPIPLAPAPDSAPPAPPAPAAPARPTPGDFGHKLAAVLATDDATLQSALETYDDFYGAVTGATLAGPRTTSQPLPAGAIESARQKGPAFALQFLEGLWIRDIVTAVQLLRATSRGAYDVLAATHDTMAPRTRLAWDALAAPQLVYDEVVAHGRRATQAPADDKDACTNPTDDEAAGWLAASRQVPKDQAMEMWAAVGMGQIAGRPAWSGGWLSLPLATKATPLTERQQITVDLIRRFREALPIHAGLKASGPGFVYGGNPRADRKPEEIAPKPGTDGPGVASTDRVANALWDEINGEGSSSAINTWDSAILSWGRGWAGKGGQLPQLLRVLGGMDPGLMNELAQAGFTITPTGAFTAVDLATGLRHEGDGALNLVRQDQRLLSFLIMLGESPAHAQAVAEATWSVLKEKQALPAADTAKGRAVREKIAGWPPTSIQFVEHSIHWAGGLSWDLFLPSGGDLAKIVSIMVKALGGNFRMTPSGARVAVGYGYVPLAFANGVLMKSGLLGEPAPLPTDLETAKGTYPGVVWFPERYGAGFFFEEVEVRGKKVKRYVDQTSGHSTTWDPARLESGTSSGRAFRLTD